MTKAQLIAQVAKDARLSKSSAERAINAVTSSITQCLKEDDKITLTGFGTFMITHRKARKGVNPQTKKPIQIKSMTMPRFKAGKILRQSL